MKNILLIILMLLLATSLIMQVINSFKDMRNLELSREKLLKELQLIDDTLKERNDKNGN